MEISYIMLRIKASALVKASSFSISEEVTNQRTELHRLLFSCRQTFSMLNSTNSKSISSSDSLMTKRCVKMFCTIINSPT